MAKKASSGHKTGKSKVSGELDENPLPEGETEDDSPPPDKVEGQVLDLMIITKRNASRGPEAPDERSLREISVHSIAAALHRMLLLGDDRALAAMTKAAVIYLNAHATFIDGTNLLTRQAFFSHLLECLPAVVEQPGQPVEEVCNRLVSLIRLGRRASKEVAKLSPEVIRSNLVREFTANPLRSDTAPEELVQKVLGAAGLSRDFVNNGLDGSARTGKSRAGKKTEGDAATAPRAAPLGRPPGGRSSPIR